MVLGSGDSELELGVPSGDSVEDGEWVLAIFELGSGRRATSAAARAELAPDGMRLIFEPRDWRRLAEFAQTDARRPSMQPPAQPGRSSSPDVAGSARRSSSAGRASAPTDPALVPDTAKSS